jgi:hypothetical protein
MSGNCGIVKIDIPWLSGNQIFALASVTSLGFMTLGAVMSEISIRSLKNKNRSRVNAVYFLAGTLVGTAVFGYFGLWILGVLGLGVAAILACVVIFRG